MMTVKLGVIVVVMVKVIYLDSRKVFRIHLESHMHPIQTDAWICG